MSTELLEAPKTESTVIAKFEMTKEQLNQAVKDSSLITVAGPDDKKGMALARENRLSLQKMRTTIEKKRQELKADALAYGKKVDAVAKELTAIIQPEEQRLKELEETALREAERLAELEKQAREVENKRRCELLAAIGVMVPVIELSFMESVAFEAFYLSKKMDYDLAKKMEADAEAARKAESERLAKVAAEQAERQAEIDRQQAELAKKQAEQQAELDRQKAEIEAKERAIREQEEERRIILVRSRSSSLAAVGAPIDTATLAMLTEEEFAEKLEAETKAFEKRKADEAKAEAFRKEQEAKAEAERIAELAKDLQEKRERERLAEIARKEAEAKAAEEEAAMIAAMAPDREKIDDYLCSVNDIAVPTLSSDEASEALEDVIDSFTDSLRELITRLQEGTL